MEFPPDWDIGPMEDFEVACAALAESGEPLLVQLLAQLRPTGRILDNFWLAVGGTQILDLEVDLGHIIPAPSLQGFKFSYQFWPRDIAIRRNMTTSSWIDVPALVAANNAAAILTPTGAGLPSAEFTRVIGELPDEGPETGAIRWAVVVGEDDHLKLQLQALPSDAASLNGRPLTRG
jgi:hypothetical protein